MPRIRTQRNPAVTLEYHMLLRAILGLQMLFLAAGERLRRDDGATAVEYGIMVAAIAAVIVTVVIAVGAQVNGAFGRVRDALATLTGG